MIMPNLMRQFKEMYNDYDIRGVIGNAEQLREMFDWEWVKLDCVHIQVILTCISRYHRRIWRRV